MINQEIFKDKWLYPQTEPDQQNKTRRLNIEPNDFNGDVEQMKFSYSFGKGEGLYFTAPPTACRVIIEALQDCLRKSEKCQIKFTNENGNKPPVSLIVGREDNLMPFMAIAGEIQGVGARQKKFYFMFPKGFKIVRDGQQVSDLEQAERVTRAFITNFEKFLTALDDRYKPREFQQGRGSFGNGGYNNNQGGGQQRQPSAPPATTDSYDDFM